MVWGMRRKLHDIWQPTFGALERWKLFLQAPITLFYFNSLIWVSFTTLFTAFFVWIRLGYMREQIPGGFSPYPPVGIVELVLAGYFFLSFSREMFQLGMSMLMVGQEPFVAMCRRRHCRAGRHASIRVCAGACAHTRGHRHKRI